MKSERTLLWNLKAPALPRARSLPLPSRFALPASPTPRLPF